LFSILLKPLSCTLILVKPFKNNKASNVVIPQKGFARYNQILVDSEGIFQRKVVNKSAIRIKSSGFDTYSPVVNFFLWKIEKFGIGISNFITYSITS